MKPISEMTKGMVLTLLALVLGVFASTPVQTNPPRPFTLAAAGAIPGFGGSGSQCGTNPGFLTPVRLFQFNGTRPVAVLPNIPPCPLSFLNDAFGMAFNAQGELFVGNRHGNQENVGSIARFVFDQAGNPVANGVILDPSLSMVHGLTFSRRGELFAVNPRFPAGDALSHSAPFGTIARFRFDRSGAAIPNGTIDVGGVGFRPVGLAFNRRDELFVTTQYGNSNAILRFVFDQDGTAIPNGSFIVPGASSDCCHGPAFSHRGELFVADHVAQKVFRFLFDSAGNPIFNGSFFAIGSPIGLAFSPPGELFVSSHYGDGIARFLFDASGNPVSNGLIPTPPLGGVAVFP